MTVKLTLGDKTVDAEKMDFKTLDDAWSVIRLEDGTVIKDKSCSLRGLQAAWG